MRIRKKKWAEPELDICPYFIKKPEELFGKWKSFFNNNNRTQLEIGCGKCTFVAKKALENPDTNFIAIDIKSDMLGVGRRNIEKLFSENNREVKNLALCAYNVEHIEKIISKEDKICALYINFCNPWPRKKHNKRRLTFPIKLNKYKEFLTADACVYFKTDDDDLFSDSIEYFKQCGYNITFITYDLHNSEVSNNIVTEHEKMFSQQGIKIKYLTAKIS